MSRTGLFAVLGDGQIAHKGRLSVSALLVVLLTMAGCEQSQEADSASAAEQEPVPVNFDDDGQKISYAMGQLLGEITKARNYAALDREVLMVGLTEALDGEARLPREELSAALAQMQSVVSSEASGLASAFLKGNGERAEVTVTESGLQYEILSSGPADGVQPVATDTVLTHYHGQLIDGSVFDSSVERGQPAQFPLNRVIPGWTEGLQLMRPGDKWRFYVPPELGYGARGAGEKIPPNSVLVFEVELLEVNPGAG